MKRGLTAPPARPRAPGRGWIIGAREDLLWLHASVLPGLALLGLFLLLPGLNEAAYTAGHPAVLLLFLWGWLFDGTHVWGTYARTYLAPRGDAGSRAGLPGAWAWLLLPLGGLVALLDAGLCTPGPSLLGTGGWLFRGFLLAAYGWAYWHLVRQHWGFVALYRRKAAASSRAGARLEGALLGLGCLLPFLRFGLSEAFAASGLPQLVPAAQRDLVRMLLDVGGVLGLAVLLAFLLSGRFEKLRLGPRHLLLAIVIGFHWLVFACLDNLLAITACLTIFHNLQYHRIVWHYEQGRGRKPLGGLRRYLGLGALFGLLWYGPRVLGVAWTGSSLLRNVLLGLGWGVAFHHYLVDGRIWRLRRREVARSLDVEDPR